MAEPYIGEIRIFAGSFAIQGWAFCDGSLLSISQNQPLYNLIGTTYGGDGSSQFALPNLLGRVPICQGQGPNLSNYVLGQQGGQETVTLTVNQLPSHNHLAVGTVEGNVANSPANHFWGNGDITQNIYGPSASVNAKMNPASIAMTGGNQQHDNMLPFLVLTFIIALYGRYPSPN
jgi:microcystin-dependent protein